MFCNWVFLPWSDSYGCLSVTQVVAKVAHFRLYIGTKHYVHWIHFAQDRDHWQAWVNNSWVAERAWALWEGFWTIIVSYRLLLNAVCTIVFLCYINSCWCFSEMCTWDLVDGKCREVVKLPYVHTSIQVQLLWITFSECMDFLHSNFFSYLVSELHVSV